MKREDVLRMARVRFGGYADQAASLFEQFANDIRSATKEEDARIAGRLYQNYVDTMNAHYRLSDDQFNGASFGFDMKSVMESKNIQNAILESK